MVDEFTLQFKAQQEWGWLAVLDFFLAGSGAGLFLIGMVLGLDSVGAIGVVAAALGALTLLADLGHPERFWRAISRPGTSWISRGAILVTVFIICGAIHAAPAVSFLSWLPWTSGSALGLVTGVIAALAAIGVMAYTGFLLADSPAVPAWQSALVPVQFVVISLLTGAGGLYLLLPFTNAARVNLQIWEATGVGLGVCALLMLLAYPLILGSSTSGARRAGHELIGGHLGLPFLGGGVLVGLVVPIAVILYQLLAGSGLAAATAPLGLAGLFFIIGGLSFRYSLLKAGFYEPVLQASIMQGMGR